MDYLTKRRSNYMELVGNGISCGKLSQFRAGADMWQIEVNFNRGVSKETAKRLIRAYVESEWEATDVSYFVIAGKAGNWFTCRFRSRVL